MNCLGHSDEGWAETVAKQAGKLCHTSNLYLHLGDVKGQLSHEKNLGWLGYIGDYTTQLYRDYDINHYHDPY